MGPRLDEPERGVIRNGAERPPDRPEIEVRTVSTHTDTTGCEPGCRRERQPCLTAPPPPAGHIVIHPGSEDERQGQSCAHLTADSLRHEIVWDWIDVPLVRETGKERSLAE